MVNASKYSNNITFKLSAKLIIFKNKVDKWLLW